MGRLLCVVLALTVGAGCATVTEADRELNHQNVDAARVASALIAAGAADPTGTLAALGVILADVGKNSSQLQASLGGPPKAPKPYSTEESQKARDAAKASHETPWWKVALGGVGTFMIGLLTSGQLARFFPFLAGSVGTALALVTSGFARVREKATANGGTINMVDLLSAMKTEAETNPKAHALIKDFAHKAEEKLGLHL